MTAATRSQLIRLRWAVRAVLALGVAASTAGNVLHAADHPISQAIAAWPPLALLLTVELISRIPVHTRTLAAARYVATATIAGIAAWVSYWHMVGVAARYGETGASPYLLPLSVDGLVVVASICLVELGGRIAAAAPAIACDPAAEPIRRITVEPVVVSRDDPAEPIAEPVKPEPITEPIAEPVREPVEPEPVRRVIPSSLTTAAAVLAAHQAEPDATHARIAELAGCSLATVKRHRPARARASLSGSRSTQHAAATHQQVAMV